MHVSLWDCKTKYDLDLGNYEWLNTWVDGRVSDLVGWVHEWVIYDCESEFVREWEVRLMIV